MADTIPTHPTLSAAQPAHPPAGPFTHAPHPTISDAFRTTLSDYIETFGADSTKTLLAPFFAAAGVQHISQLDTTAITTIEAQMKDKLAPVTGTAPTVAVAPDTPGIPGSSPTVPPAPPLLDAEAASSPNAGAIADVDIGQTVATDPSTPYTDAEMAQTVAAQQIDEHIERAGNLKGYFQEFLHDIGESAQGTEKFASRELSLAWTKIEEAEHWVMSHLLKKHNAAQAAAAPAPTPTTPQS